MNKHVPRDRTSAHKKEAAKRLLADEHETNTMATDLPTLAVGRVIIVQVMATR